MNGIKQNISHLNWQFKQIKNHNKTEDHIMSYFQLKYIKITLRSKILSVIFFIIKGIIFKVNNVY